MDVGGLVDRCRQVGKTGWLVGKSVDGGRQLGGWMGEVGWWMSEGR